MENLNNRQKIQLNEGIMYNKYWYTGALEVVQELEKKRNLQEQTKRSNYLKSIIYKIPLYKFKSSDRPIILDDNVFDEVFEYDKVIFAQVIDSNHIQEIKTKKIFPILELSKKDDRWNNAWVKYAEQAENYSQFPISENRFIKTRNFGIDELVAYMSLDESVISDYIENNLSPIKIKK